jgi:hypothetical protein
MLNWNDDSPPHDREPELPLRDFILVCLVIAVVVGYIAWRWLT